MNAQSASTRSSLPLILPSGTLLWRSLRRPNLSQSINRPLDALRLYEGCIDSAVPHLDLEQEIESGIREARTAVAQVKSFSAGAPDAV